MENKIKKEQKKNSSKSYSGIVLKKIKIGLKHDWSKGQKVSKLTLKEYNNYKLNKIIK